MKTTRGILLLVSLALTCPTSWAQPTVTATGMNPVVGESVTSYVGSYIHPGNAGANQNWDFTALAGSPGEVYSCVPSSSTANGSSFPNSNVALVTGSNSARYYSTSGSALTNHGAFANNVVVALSDAEDFLRYPFTLGNSFMDTWSGQFVNAGYTYYRSGTVTVTADAYGTIITPAGTFTNVLRVHLYEVYQDSANLFGTPFIVDYTNDEYMWYQEGFHYQVATTGILTSVPGSVYSYATYASSGAVTLEDAAGDATSSQLFPNPASEHVVISVALTESHAVGVELYTAMGQHVQALEAVPYGVGAHRLQLDVDGLPEGVYFAKVMLDGHAAETMRLVVAR